MWSLIATLGMYDIVAVQLLSPKALSVSSFSDLLLYFKLSDAEYTRSVKWLQVLFLPHKTTELLRSSTAIPSTYTWNKYYFVVNLLNIWRDF